MHKMCSSRKRRKVQLPLRWTKKTKEEEICIAYVHIRVSARERTYEQERSDEEEVRRDKIMRNSLDGMKEKG